ncbi:MAG: SPFH/Band 7/PHB domain protein [Candidatus Sericytochromatia bacterium]|nr:SPFH/Band 7/PHB domain protein [Candidatus Tanganyikabacteria bacterium]
MEGGLFVLFVLAIFIIVVVSKGLVIVKQAETMVIERLGRYYTTIGSGLSLIIPLIDQPRSIDWKYAEEAGGRQVVRRIRTARIDLRETVLDIPKQNVITKDNVATEISALVFIQITDPKKAVYEIANLPDSIEKLTQTSLRNIIGEMDLDESLNSRDTINTKLRVILDEAGHKWGVKVTRVELQDINPPRDIREAMEKQMRAERDRRAQILEAEGTKRARILEAEGMREAEINKAEGEKRARVLRAEGEAEARLRVAQAESASVKTLSDTIAGTGGNPANFLIAMRYIETLREMVSGRDNKVIYLPYEATSLLGAVGGIKDIFDGARGQGVLSSTRGGTHLG